LKTNTPIEGEQTMPPGKVICVGLNYLDHAAEAGAEVPTTPICFAKWPNSLIGHGDPIRRPSFTDELDYEAELAVVIGRSGADIAEADALDHVAGYACFNDVTDRAVQRAESQWTRSKSFDTFGPMGPVVPAADVGDPQTLAIRCLVNGEVVQASSTAKMIFSVASIIAHISTSTTLEPGDIIATGTPAGIGLTHVPPRFLVPGDEVTVDIERIGVLSNPVV